MQPSKTSATAPTLDEKTIKHLALLSFKEGRGRLTSKENDELEILSAIDLVLSPKASYQLNKLMQAAYTLGYMIETEET